MAHLDYASRDYDTIKSDLLARAQRVFPEWTDRDPSDFGMLLVDLWASMGDVIHYYIDRAAGEAFLSTAQQRESVLALANLMDYTPRGRSSAIGSVTLSNTGGASVGILPLTEFVARYDNNTYQLYTESGGFVPASSTANVVLYEGTLTVEEVLTTSSNGQSGQRYSLQNEDVVNRSTQVFVYEDGVNPVSYQHVSRIATAVSGDRVFSTNVTADGATEIVFGTNLNGFVPPTGSKITCTYASSSGASGNLPANSVVGFKESPPENVSVQSSTAFSGGVDEESITSLKQSIPGVISAQNRAVTRNDFVALALQVDGVAKATIEFAPSQAGPSAGNASVTVYPQAARSDYLTTVDTFQTVSTDMRTNVVNAIQPRALLGVNVYAASQINWQPLDLETTIYVSDRYVTAWVEADVQAAIDELFTFDNVFFGQRITLGQLYRILLGVPGVDYCTIEVFDLTGGSTLQTSILIDPLKLPKKGTVTLTMVGGISTS